MSEVSTWWHWKPCPTSTGGDTSLACAADTASIIDQKVITLVKEQHQKALQILQDNLPKLHELAKYLYEKETITGEEFMDILNRA